MRACVRACVRACMRACMRACVQYLEVQVVWGNWTAPLSGCVSPMMRDIGLTPGKPCDAEHQKDRIKTTVTLYTSKFMKNESTVTIML